jgi:hypothetical protein
MPTRAAYLTNPLVLDATDTAVGLHQQAVANTPLGDVLPDTVRRWLARIRLLEGVPFAHLVCDADLLPPESIRFFYVDREWTDTLVQGALAVGTVTSLDRRVLQALHAHVRDEIDTEERKVRAVGGEAVGIAPGGAISGFLLRSRAVSGWPALHVRAFSEEIGPDDTRVDENDPRRIRLLRLERLAPAVLLALFDGIPAIVHIEEPRQGIQFGVDLVVGDGGLDGATIALRDVDTGERLDTLMPPPPGATQVEVPFRLGAPGVLHVAELARRIAAQPATHVDAFEGPGVQSAELAMEMLQFPFRQVFGQVPPDNGRVPTFADQFRPTVGIADVRAWEAGGHP